MIRVEPVTAVTLSAWADLRVALWPDEDEAALRVGAAAHVTSPDATFRNLVALLDEKVVGFAEASIRRDYVNGTSTSPVVFLEGIFVLPAHRRAGAGGMLQPAAMTTAPGAPA